MQDWLAARAQVSPHTLALVTPHTRWTYRQLNDRAQQYAAQLGHFERVGLLLTGEAESVALIHAAMRAGVLLVPLNTRLTYEEIKWQLRNTDCTTLVVSNDLLSLLPYDVRAADDPFTLVYLPKYDRDFKHKPRTLEDKAPISLAAPFVIVHTSGTSGKPKGAVLTYGNVFHSAMASAYRIGHLPEDMWLCVLPLYHVGGLSIIIRAVLYGIAVDLRPKFDVADINHALSHGEITLASLVPTMLYRLLDARTTPWSPALRLVLLGGARATPELMRRCLDEHIPVATTYGMSEAASQIATTLPGDAARKPGTVGKPLMFTQVKIVDAQGNPQPPNAYGEILVQGPTVMRGYYGDPEATAQALRDGWLHSGDIGYLDDDGDLWLVQRRSDLIVTGGENVYPAEVEDALRQHPAIADAAVVGLDDPEWGQRVAAAIVIAPDQTLSEAAVETHARAHLAGYKIPRRVLFVEALPQTSSGKIPRPAVKALFD